MVLSHLSIINYKNIEQAELTLSPKINCFVGNNGMGKTNLLDAVYYLSFCKSYTNPIDTQAINHGTDVCMIQGHYSSADGATDEVYVAIRRKQKKQFKRNKKEYGKLSEHIGYIPLVVISPNDNELIAGVSAERRKFLDMAISQCDKEYLHALVSYNKALQQRNQLLKAEAGVVDDMLLDLWEDMMVENGTKIYTRRANFVNDFTPIFDDLYRTISAENEYVSLRYVSQIEEQDFKTQLVDARRKDLLLGHTTVGIHRDDIDLLLDGYPIKKVGSQGQNKTCFVSMKLAQFLFLSQQSGHKTPILLLDDIFDRLDAQRVSSIIEVVSRPEFGQIFISDTNRESIDRIIDGWHSDYHIYRVENGEISLTTE